MGTRAWDETLDYAQGTLAASHDPSKVANLQIINGYVQTDYDLSSNHYDENAAIAQVRPAYASSAINGLGALLFTGSERFQNGSLPIAPPVRTFIIALQTSDVTQTIQTLYGSKGFRGLQFRLDTGGLALVSQGVANIGASTQNLISNNTTFIAAGSYNQSSGAYSFRYNGGNVGSGNTSVSLTEEANASIVGFNGVSSGEEFYGLRGGEIILNTDALSDIQLAEGKLAHQWGVQLQAGHPYAAAAPVVSTGGAARRRPLILMAS